MQKYLVLLLSAMMTISLFTQAQHKISGKITEAGTNIPLAGVGIGIKNGTHGIVSKADGTFLLKVGAGKHTISVSYIGYNSVSFTVNDRDTVVNIALQPSHAALEEVVVVQYDKKERRMEDRVLYSQVLAGRTAGVAISKSTSRPYPSPAPVPENTESYAGITENGFKAVKDKPLSTFSIDVDRASYSNIRRFLNDGTKPPTDAVRVEEMINYFDYQYKSPAGKDPVAIYTDMAICPWDSSKQLVRVALKAREIPKENLPPSNLVFLIDVSGSMSDYNKLPLLKQAMKALVQELRPVDRVSIVVYAGAAGVVLPSTRGSEKKKIIDALENLEAGGSTAGEAGIKLAYSTAASHLLENGNNRVIIATDGDFNVGPSSESELLKLIAKEREKGIFLSVLGFGMGNYKDDKLELLADKGNGNYAYIDNFEEARRTFVTEFGGTLFTVAKDVKLQIEFNPKYVQAYRLVGYENRLLNDEDFNDDKKDAGEMGAGHTVTALYEVIPTGNKEGTINWVDPLKYQQQTIIGSNTAEVLTVKLRYKDPKSKTSQLISHVLPWKEQKISSVPEDFRMATAVAAFGLLLRDSQYKGSASYDQVLALAGNARGNDPEGYRAEFIQLVKKAMIIE